MKTRVFTLILAVLMLSGCFIACADNSTDNTGSGTTQANETVDPNAVYVDTNGYEIDALPADLNYGDNKVTALAWSDYTMQEFESASETMTADIVDDAILKRNTNVEQRLGIELEYIYKPGNDKNMTQFIKDAEAGEVDGSYDFIASYSRVAPKLAINGKLCDLYELQHMNDLSKPWWPVSLVQEATINDGLYFCTGDISTNTMWMMQATFYNKSLITRYSLEDPYELVMSGEWTFPKFFEMCANKYEDLGTEGKSAEDRYGLTIYQLNIDDYQISADIIPIINNNGQLELSGDFDKSKMTDFIEDMQGFISSNDVFYQNETKQTRNVFFEERSVFMTDRVFVIAGKDNSSDTRKIEFEYGIVPNPKYKKSQSDYITNIGHPFTMYSVPVGLTDDEKQMAGAVLECLASESYRTVTPQVFELAMKIKYSYGEEASSMFDTIKRTQHYDMGRIFNIGANGFVSSAFRTEVISMRNSWVSNYKGARSRILSDIEAINNIGIND